MKCLKYLTKIDGLNFLEMTAALGLVGMGALVGTSLVTKTSKDAKKTEQKLEIESMIGNVKQVLANKEVCEYNFQGQPIQQTYNQLRDPGADISNTSDDTNFIQTGTSNYLKTIQISNISTRELSADDTENMELVINFAPIGNQASQSLQNMERRLTLQVTSINGRINSCFSDLAESSDVSLEEICTGSNSIYDSVNDQCLHFGFDTTNNCNPAAGQIMVGARLNPSTLMIEPICAGANPTVTMNGCSGSANPSSSGIVSGVVLNADNVQVNCQQMAFQPIQAAGVIDSTTTNCSNPSGISVVHSGNRIAMNCSQPTPTPTPRPIPPTPTPIPYFPPLPPPPPPVGGGGGGTSSNCKPGSRHYMAGYCKSGGKSVPWSHIISCGQCEAPQTSGSVGLRSGDSCGSITVTCEPIPGCSCP